MPLVGEERGQDPLPWQQLRGHNGLWTDGQTDTRRVCSLLVARGASAAALLLLLFQIITHRCREPLCVFVSWM